MKIALRAFLSEDVPLLQRWIRVGDFSNFMSRWSPYSFSGGSWPDDLVRWHMIIAEEQEIGTIWMERDSSSSRTCDMGIMICDPSCRGRGLGTEAIFLAEQDAAMHWGTNLVRLRVRASNARAISCYQRSGYEISSVTSKEIDRVTIQVLHMEHHMGTRNQQAEQGGGGDSAALRESP